MDQSKSPYTPAKTDAEIARRNALNHLFEVGPECALKTITEAIAAAATAATITLIVPTPGTHTESLTLNAYSIVRPTCPDTVTIDGDITLVAGSEIWDVTCTGTVTGGTISRTQRADRSRASRYPTVAYPGKLASVILDDGRKSAYRIETGLLLDDMTSGTITSWTLLDGGTGKVTVGAVSQPRPVSLVDAEGTTPGGYKIRMESTFTTGVIAWRPTPATVDLAATPYNYVGMWIYTHTAVFQDLQVGFSASTDFSDPVWLPLTPQPWNQPDGSGAYWDLRAVKLSAAVKALGSLKSIGFQVLTDQAACSINIDDIRLNYTGASPIDYASSNGIPLTLAIWNTQIGTDGFLTAGDIREAHTLHGCKIGGHSYTHGASPYYAPYTDAEIVRETKQSRDELMVFDGSAAGRKLESKVWPTMTGIEVDSYFQPGWARYHTEDTTELSHIDTYPEAQNKYAEAVRRYFDFSRAMCGVTLPGQPHFGQGLGATAASIAAFIGTSPYSVAPGEDFTITIDGFETSAADAAYSSDTGITHLQFSQLIDALVAWRAAGLVYPVSFSTFFTAIRLPIDTAIDIPLVSWGDCVGLTNANFQSGASVKRWTTAATGAALTTGDGGYAGSGEGIKITGSGVSLFYSPLSVVPGRRYVGSIQVAGTGVLRIGIKMTYSTVGTDYVTVYMENALPPVDGTTFERFWFAFSPELWAKNTQLILRRDGVAAGNLVVDDLRLKEV
jgi:hypothetical protein